MILADEGLNFNIIRDLRSEGYAVEWVKELGAGMKDEDIITLAKENKQVLITEDKDFGEWIFAHQIEGLSIVFLRYEKEDLPAIINFLKSALTSKEDSSQNEFITINKNKIRRRKI